MALSQSIVITRVSDSKKFIFFTSEVPNADYGLVVKRFKVEIPDGDAEDNLSINMGVSETRSFSFRLSSTPDDDAAGGTHTSTVNTIAEKVSYLIDGSDPFVKTGIQDFYTVEIVANNCTFPSIKTQVDSLSFSPNSTQTESLNGRFSFTVGGGKQ